MTDRIRKGLLLERIPSLPGHHVTDHQMRLYMKFRQTDAPPVAGAKAAFSGATAYRFEADPRPPSQRVKPRDRRRPDPLADIFDVAIVPLLEAAPGLRAVAIFEEMQRCHPILPEGVRRTMERRIRAWRALHGADWKVIFRQTHEPGRMACRTPQRWPNSPSPLPSRNSTMPARALRSRSRCPLRWSSCSAIFSP